MKFKLIKQKEQVARAVFLGEHKDMEPIDIDFSLIYEGDIFDGAKPEGGAALADILIKALLNLDSLPERESSQRLMNNRQYVVQILWWYIVDSMKEGEEKILEASVDKQYKNFLSLEEVSQTEDEPSDDTAPADTERPETNEVQLENSTSHDTMSKDMKLPETEPMEYQLTRRFIDGVQTAEVKFLGALVDEPKTHLVRLRCGQWVFVSRIYKVFVEKHLKQDIPVEKMDEMFEGFEKWITGYVEDMEEGDSRTLLLSVNADGEICNGVRLVDHLKNVGKLEKKPEEPKTEKVNLFVDSNKFKHVKNVRVDEESRMVYFEQHYPNKMRTRSWMPFNSITIQYLEA